ncbi:hypothetical protein B9G98_03472 [Wickerhamiella sorbophila]|uniref:Uncharacterized protein n=1 Tax=Wickerhamiella sorbophila TaxID=45607 RepID=A0A2T0FLJ8_9ASCO|nr:hypothetical protein B9G98_03472 [Wickerhamiella sorbophila]PRT55852.1 hypothetical protein B9G98_03472 [Wickerhamiella sorbophila]
MWFRPRNPDVDRPESEAKADDEAERKLSCAEHRAARRAARVQRRHERLLRWRSRFPQFRFKHTSNNSTPTTENSSHLSRESTVIQLPIDSLKKLQLKTKLKLSAERAVDSNSPLPAQPLSHPTESEISVTAGGTDSESWVSTIDGAGLTK